MMTYSHECGCFYADPYPTATPAMSQEMQRLDRDPDDIGYDRAELRQRAAEDGVQFFDEDDWYDELAGMDLEDQFDALLDEAIDERFGLPAWEEAREREREAMPPVMGGLPW